MKNSEEFLKLRAIKSFHVGGGLRQLRGLPLEKHQFAQNGPAREVDPNGDHISGQMYVQAFLNAEPRHATPVLLWHGGGMTGANWESTPDGRPGWLTRFLLAGFDVYVSDAVERGRASWSRWPEIYAGPPLFRTLQEGWEMFRIGAAGSYGGDAANSVPFPGQQFPADAFEHFASQWVPRWTGHEDITMHAYGKLLERVGPCIVIGHSQGGGFALDAARRWPGQIAAVVAVEPSGAPAAAGDRAVRQVTAHPPHLVVWGDNIAGHPVWPAYRNTVDGYIGQLAAQGLSTTTLDLPRAGLPGNSHFPMLDRNSDEVAEKIIDWLVASTA